MAKGVHHVKRRRKLDIWNEILERVREPATKKDIMYDVRLSFSQTTDYIALMNDCGLLEEVNQNGEIAYRTTREGLRYIQCYKELRSLLGK